MMLYPVPHLPFQSFPSDLTRSNQTLGQTPSLSGYTFTNSVLPSSSLCTFHSHSPALPKIMTPSSAKPLKTGTKTLVQVSAVTLGEVQALKAATKLAARSDIWLLRRERYVLSLRGEGRSCEVRTRQRARSAEKRWSMTFENGFSLGVGVGYEWGGGQKEKK